MVSLVAVSVCLALFAFLGILLYIVGCDLSAKIIIINIMMMMMMKIIII